MILPASLQWYGFTQFCGLTKVDPASFSDGILSVAKARSYKMPSSEPSEWCSHGSTAFGLPLSYSYVQSHYWNVGFLRYYQLKQLPQFVLAAPIFYLIFLQGWRFLAVHHKYYSLRLGLTHFGMDPAKRVPSFDYYAVRGLPRECFVYAVHACALALFCLLCAHVQVSTRILCSSCPIIYWWAAMLTASEDRVKPVPGVVTNHNIEACLFKHPFYKRSPSKGTKLRTLHRNNIKKKTSKTRFYKLPAAR